jgi:hypothetical protein
MAERKSFLLRIDGQVLDALRKWAAEDLRSLNGQVEFLLRRALRERGRLPRDFPESLPEDPNGELPSHRS